MTQVDTSIPTFLKRKPGDAPAPKSAVEQINEARKKDGLRPYEPKQTKAPKKAGKLVEKAIAARDKLAATAKNAASKSASTPNSAEKAKSKSAPKKKKGDSPERKAKVELLLKTLSKKGGVDNKELAKALGRRPSAHSMRVVCQNHDKRLKIVKKEGEPTRYMI